MLEDKHLFLINLLIINMQNHHHDIRITTPWTVFTFIGSLIISFCSWFTFFVLIPIVSIGAYNRAHPQNLFLESWFPENEFSVFFNSVILTLTAVIIFFYLYFLPLTHLFFNTVYKLKLLLSSKTIRLENDQIKFIPAISFFQKDPIILPRNLLKLSVEEKHIKYKPIWLIEFRFISQDAKPLIFFKIKDISLAKKIDQEIADFYQIKLTEKFKIQSNTWE
jgi:hypothetical protein